MDMSEIKEIVDYALRGAFYRSVELVLVITFFSLLLAVIAWVIKREL